MQNKFKKMALLMLVLASSGFLYSVGFAYDSVYKLLSYDSETLALIDNGIKELENGNLDRGEEILSPFALKGDRFLQEHLALALMDKTNDQPLMTPRSFKWWQLLAESFDPMAQTLIGSAYYLGEGVKKDFEQAIYWTKQAADVGYGGAQHNLGVFYLKGAEGILPMPEKAIECFLSSASQGYAESQFALCKIYDEGKQAPPDPVKAFKYCEEAAKQGHVEAQFYVGSMCEHGDGTVQDYKEAAMWYLKAAESDHVQSIYSLGVLSYQGKGFARDIKQALLWFEMAAGRGHNDAKYWLDVIYPEAVSEGIGFFEQEDFERAFPILDMASRKGFSEAQTRLGQMYARGDDIERDDNIACDLFEKAAIQGDPRGYELLGLMYLEGRGVSEDFEKGLSYILYAAAKGRQSAREFADNIYKGFELALSGDKYLTFISRNILVDRNDKKWFWCKSISFASDNFEHINSKETKMDSYRVVDCDRMLVGAKQINDSIFDDDEIEMRAYQPGSIGYQIIEYVCADKR